MNDNKHVQVDPRPYDRATAIINFLIVIAVSLVIFAGVFGAALAIDWALTALGGAVCK